MSTIIDIKEAIFDVNSYFNIKRFNVKNLSIQRPTKVLDIKNINKEIFEEFKNLFDVIIFESSIFVKLNSIKNINNTSDDEKIKNHFKFRRWISNYNFIISATFDFDPFKDINKLDDLEGYLRYLYEYSSPFVFVPNLKIEKMIYKNNNKKTKIKLINIKKYIKFVDYVIEILEYKNDKPIFVPVSLKFSINEIKKLAQHYINKNYFCIWFDFEGSAVTETKIARIKRFLKEFENQKQINSIIIYATNIKREIISNLKDDKSPASDVLTSLIGANLIGVNREPQKPSNSNNKNINNIDLRYHKARIFDNKSYYYVKAIKLLKESYILEKILNKKEYNNLMNNQLLNEEFKIQTNEFLKNYTIKNYISKKQMLKEYKNGKLLHNIVRFDQKITDWY